MPEIEADRILLTRIVLERHMSADGRDHVTAEFRDGEGDTPRLVEILGLLDLSKDTAIRACLDGDTGDDDDDTTD